MQGFGRGAGSSRYQHQSNTNHIATAKRNANPPEPMRAAAFHAGGGEPRTAQAACLEVFADSTACRKRASQSAFSGCASWSAVIS
jgi:hypothetical protein